MKFRIQRLNKKYLGILGIAVLLASIFPYTHVQAAQVTSLSDTLTRLKASTAADHTLYFVTPTGLTAGQTITLTFAADFTGVSSIAFGDVDFATGSTGVCSSATFTEQTLAASPSGATWGLASSGQVVTLTSGTGTVTAGRCVRFKIGTNATTGTTGTNQITNGPVDDDDTVVIGGTFGDSGTLSVDIITDDQVVVSATVDPTITFAISQTSVSFGTLSSGTGRWATNGGGANAAAGTDPTSSNTAHNLTVSTNGQSGYAVSYNGATLTSGSNTITVATVSSDSDGTPGSEQFALCAKATSGSQTVTSGYACSTTSSYNFVASTTTTLVSYTGPANANVTAVAYLANISGTTEAGAYTTTITYIATATY